MKLAVSTFSRLPVSFVKVRSLDVKVVSSRLRQGCRDSRLDLRKMAEAVAALYAIRYLEITEARSLRRQRVYRDRTNAFELSELSFRELFRLPKHLVLGLVDDLREQLSVVRPSRRSLPVETKVLAALRFYATGSYQRVIGQEITICLGQKSVSNCVTQVSAAICHVLLKRWITFPTSVQQQVDVKSGFLRKYKFPGVLGAIDCTHIAIVAPKTNQDGQLFMNRKRFHSLNVQMICDSRMNILSVNAGFPGSTHDAYIWSASEIRSRIADAASKGLLQDSFLIGDSGYPLEPWLLTPIPLSEYLSAEEERYNAALSKARGVVECLFGMLKQVWRCTLKHRTLHYCPERAVKIVLSCCVLHNMYLCNNIPFPEEQNEQFDLNVREPLEAGTQTIARGNPLATAGAEMQQKLLHSFFSQRNTVNV